MLCPKHREEIWQDSGAILHTVPRDIDRVNPTSERIESFPQGVTACGRGQIHPGLLINIALVFTTRANIVGVFKEASIWLMLAFPRQRSRHICHFLYCRIMYGLVSRWLRICLKGADFMQTTGL